MSEHQSDQFHRVLLTRTTVHDFSDTPLPEGALERALEAALAAPNHRLTEPWRFVLAGLQTRERLAVLMAQLKDKNRAPQPDTVERARQKMLTPAALVVACRVRSVDCDIEREDYAALACAIENLSLSLWAEGIASKWGTGAISTHEQTYDILGVDAQVQEIVGFIWVGYPGSGGVPRKPLRRLGVEQVVRRLP